ncbi:MAG: histidine phosphatase family protein, partial [Microthrixaceae bacterium]
RGLTDVGRMQAEMLRARLVDGHLRADVLLASELPRAIETANIIAPALGFEEVALDCDLCEVHTGTADGMEWTEYSRRFGHLDMAAEPDRVFAEGGDSWNTFHERVRSMLERLAIEHEGRTVVAVCHAGVIIATLTVLFGLPSDHSTPRLLPANTGLTEWEHDGSTRRWTLRTYNDASHLQS